MPTVTRRVLGVAAGAFLFASSLAAGAEPDPSPLAAGGDGQPPVNVLAGDRVAIHGYDPVAYFVEGGPRRGKPELAVEHGDARWLFSSEANKQRFEDDADRYLPAYGGYCAYGVSQGYLVKIDPEAWSIVHDRLYLNYDQSVRTTWLEDVPGYLAKADANWPGLVGKP
jgi:hypothetical protein